MPSGAPLTRFACRDLPIGIPPTEKGVLSMGTITLRLTDDQDKQLEIIKELTGQATASKAIELLIARYPELNKRCGNEYDRAERAEMKVKRINRFYRDMVAAKSNLEDELDLGK